MARKKKTDIVPEAPKEKKSSQVTLYDVNENPITIPAENEEQYLKMGYRKELPKK